MKKEKSRSWRMNFAVPVIILTAITISISASAQSCPPVVIDNGKA